MTRYWLRRFDRLNRVNLDVRPLRTIRTGCVVERIMEVP
jgi:hypothetical protein